MPDYKMLQAILMIELAIADHLAEEGDQNAFESLDRADLAYFDHPIVLQVMGEEGY